MRLKHHAPTPPAETLLRALRLVDAETGIIRMLYEAPIAPDAARIFGCAALMSDQATIGFPSETSISGSTALTRDGAIVGAIGEAVERYSAAYTPAEQILRAPFSAVAGEAVDPTALVLYDAEQEVRPDSGYRAPRPLEPIGWIEGWSLTRARPILVPAFAVYQPYAQQQDESPVVQMVTTGLACGATLEEAVLSGLCEVVERDASMLLWLQSRRMPRVAPDIGLPAGIAEAFARFGENARHITLVDATADIAIPTYVAVWDGPLAGACGAVFASCAKPSETAAAVGALTELAQCLMWAASLIEGGASLPDPTTDAFEKIEKHVLWPLHPDARPAWAFAIASPQRADFDAGTDVPVRDVLDTIEACVGHVASAGLEAIVVDVTSPDIAEIGLSVVRVILPGAQPLFFGRGLHRISNRARQLPYRDRAAPGINLHPHPYP
jgi:ribosomal protein S12 methylthiotransferase accessory factor